MITPLFTGKRPAFSCLFIMWLFVAGLSCKKSDNNNNAPQDLAGSLVSGNWKVTAFIEDNVDETADFAGFVFSFTQGGTTTATRLATTVTGSWLTRTDSGKLKFELSYDNIDPVEELNEDWVVLERSATRIRLQHTSGGDGSVDLLTLERL